MASALQCQERASSLLYSGVMSHTHTHIYTYTQVSLLTVVAMDVAGAELAKTASDTSTLVSMGTSNRACEPLLIRVDQGSSQTMRWWTRSG